LAVGAFEYDVAWLWWYFGVEIYFGLFVEGVVSVGAVFIIHVGIFVIIPFLLGYGSFLFSSLSRCHCLRLAHPVWLLVVLGGVALYARGAFVCASFLVFFVFCVICAFAVVAL